MIVGASRTKGVTSSDDSNASINTAPRIAPVNAEIVGPVASIVKLGQKFRVRVKIRVRVKNRVIKELGLGIGFSNFLHRSSPGGCNVC